MFVLYETHSNVYIKSKKKMKLLNEKFIIFIKSLFTKSCCK